MPKIVYAKSKGLTEKPLHYCPGWQHGNVHKLIAELLVELDILDRTVGVSPVGCSVFACEYFDCDMQTAAIGTSEIVHAAHRGENITSIFINNAIYGMTGGRMAPTTLAGRKSSTSPFGRDPSHCGQPLRVSEMIATIPAAAYVARVSIHDVPHLAKAEEAIVWLKENMLPYFPPGTFRQPGDFSTARSKSEGGMMHEELIIAGFGGQGIMLLGKLLAEAGMEEGKYVSWLPSQPTASETSGPRTWSWRVRS